MYQFAGVFSLQLSWWIFRQSVPKWYDLKSLVCLIILFSILAVISLRKLCSFFISLLDVDECLLSPCKNGGVCQNLLGGYFCDCDHQGEYIGKHCETGLVKCWYSVLFHCWTILYYLTKFQYIFASKVIFCLRAKRMSITYPMSEQWKLHQQQWFICVWLCNSLERKLLSISWVLLKFYNFVSITIKFWCVCLFVCLWLNRCIIWHFSFRCVRSVALPEWGNLFTF